MGRQIKLFCPQASLIYLTFFSVFGVNFSIIDKIFEIYLLRLYNREPLHATVVRVTPCLCVFSWLQNLAARGVKGFR